ncbi:hypothetical protein C5167_042110 [Papaver somniferum]|nr:hypothetical protein C5167_042110 [Papaver somniferum]
MECRTAAKQSRCTKSTETQEFHHQCLFTMFLLRNNHRALLSMVVYDSNSFYCRCGGVSREASKEMSKGKGKVYDSEDPAYIPDLGFLKDIYVVAQQNP